jgi:DNA invertase Pin-like site-specific DNA recombinase
MPEPKKSFVNPRAARGPTGRSCAAHWTSSARASGHCREEAGFRSLGDTWADTTTAHGRLMLAVLGGLAEFERELINDRIGEGRERVKARGVRRKPKLTLHQMREAIKRRDAKGEPVREIARTFNVSHSTISRLHA